MSSKGWTPSCRKGEVLPGGHKVIVDGAPGRLSAQTWRCVCGRWNCKPPAEGTPDERRAAMQRAHAQHVREAFGRAS